MRLFSLCWYMRLRKRENSYVVRHDVFGRIGVAQETTNRFDNLGRDCVEAPF